MNGFFFTPYSGPLLEESADNGGGGTTEEGAADGKTTTKKGDTVDYEKEFKDLQKKYTKLETESTSSYTGLQRTLQKKDDEIKTTKESLEALTGEHTDIVKNHGELNIKVETLTSTLTEKEKEILQLRQTTTRQKLILAEFPALAKFEAEGLIPQADGATKEDGSIDEVKVRELFTKFQANLVGIADSSKKKWKEGEVPDDPNPKPLLTTAEAFLAKANEAALTGKSKEYDEYYAKYLEATQKAAPAKA